MAPRIADFIREMRSVLLSAPAEFLPVEMMAAAFDILHPGRWSGFQADDPEWVGQAMQCRAQDVPIMVVCGQRDGCTPATAGVDVLMEDDFSHALTTAQVVIVVVGDEKPLRIPDQVQLVLDQGILVATDAEIVELECAAAQDTRVLHRVQHASGGVPSLVPAVGDGRGTVIRTHMDAVDGWARRIAPAVVGEPLTLLHLWVGRAAEETVATLATHLLGRETTEEDVRRVRSQTFMTVTGGHDPCIPDMLAFQVHRRLMEQDDGSVAELRRRLIEAVCGDAVSIRITERIRLLSTFGAWRALDRLLARHLHLLPALSHSHREVLAGVWPDPAPPDCPYLARGVAYVKGAWQETARLPRPWLQLQFLLNAEQLGSSDTVARTVLAELNKVAAAAKSLHARELPAMFLAGHDRLASCLAALDPSSLSEDEAVLVVISALGMVDACAAIGRVVEAQALMSVCLRLYAAKGLSNRWYPALEPALSARAALLAGIAGLGPLNLARQKEFDEAIKGEPESADPYSRALRDIAGRYQGEWVGEPEPVREIDPDSPLAPFAAEAEALRALVAHGPAGVVWIRSLLDRTVWSSRSSDEWWPVVAVLVLAEARDGNPDAAEALMGPRVFPESLQRILQAAIAVARGQKLIANQLTEQVLAEDGVLHRWRLIASGLQAAATEDVTGASHLLASSSDWETVLGVLVLMPDPLRSVLIKNLEPRMQALPGFHPVATVRREEAPKLTPRQLEMLRGLAAGLSTQELARKLFVSVETVRTTLRHMYRRLEVHDRQSAVRRGRALGLV